MANEYRGEVSMKLGDLELTLRPSYEAIAEIENSLDRIPELLFRFTQGNVGVVDLVTIIWVTARAYDETQVGSLNSLGEAVIRNGFNMLIHRNGKPAKALQELLLNMITGGKEQKKGGAAGKKKTTNLASVGQ